MDEQAVLEIHDKDSVVRTRQAGRDCAKRLGFGSADQTRLATAISELVRNVLQHGGGLGTCQIKDLTTGESHSVPLADDASQLVQELRSLLDRSPQSGPT